MSTPHWNTGIAGQVTRNTNDIPTQIGTFVRAVDVTDHNVHLYGGDMPEDWKGFFGPGFSSPMGKPYIVAQVPQVHEVMSAVAEPQNMVTGGSSDMWRSFYNFIKGPFRNGANTNTY
jgi:hypothetical protein